MGGENPGFVIDEVAWAKRKNPTGHPEETDSSVSFLFPHPPSESPTSWQSSIYAFASRADSRETNAQTVNNQVITLSEEYEDTCISASCWPKYVAEVPLPMQSSHPTIELSLSWLATAHAPVADIPSSDHMQHLIPGYNPHADHIRFQYWNGSQA